MLSSASQSFVSLPFDARRQLLGARNSCWKKPMPYAGWFVWEPIPHWLACGRVSCFISCMNSSAFFGWLMPAWSRRFCCTNRCELEKLERATGRPKIAFATTAVFHA